MLSNRHSPQRMHLIRRLFVSFCLASLTLIATKASADQRILQIDGSKWVEIRNRGEREWAEFPETISLSDYRKDFDASVNSEKWTLTLRQQDVKESWTVSLNDQLLGRLVRDENDLQCDFEIAAGLLRETNNRLEIRTQSNKIDDIRIGNIEIYPGPLAERRSGSTIEVVITDEQQQPLPGRITIVNENGTLIPIIPLGARSPFPGANPTSGNPIPVSDHQIDARLASREGVIYTATGHASFSVQPGKYHIYAGRGFEYSVAKVQCDLRQGQHAKRTLVLTREVDTTGWIACDTHVHTVTFSGHGDCTLQERLVTLAGEGIELPIATDHNTQIDYTEQSNLLGTSKWFTPVVGNEVTTKQGHFNIFPTSAEAPRPNHQASDWGQLFDSIYSNPTVRVAILNHARDLHSNFRPFSPRHHISLSGTNLDDFDRRFNAMELINSGAVQTDPMELFRDWCGLINHSMIVTPIGSSDSHDVSRYIVGQGRTYIAGEDSNVSQLDVKAASEALAEGRVIVSYGLFANLIAEQNTDEGVPNHGVRDPDSETEIKLQATAGPGELLQLDPKTDSDLVLRGEVRLPGWSAVSHVQLWINGLPWSGKSQQADPNQSTKHPPNQGLGQTKHSTAENTNTNSRRNRQQYTWSIPRDQLTEDTWFTLLAVGPGIRSPHWPTAKPYQPDSIEFHSYVFSCTGPIRVDTNGDGRFTSARDYAQQIVDAATLPVDDQATAELAQDGASPLDLEILSSALEKTSPTVTAQLLAIVRPQIPLYSQWSETLPESVRSKIQPFERAWQKSVRAKLEQQE